MLKTVLRAEKEGLFFGNFLFVDILKLIYTCRLQGFNKESVICFMLKVFFLGVVSIAIGWMPQAQARFDTEMDKLNQAYRNKIYTSEQY